jgi:hypothetical protein
LERTGEGIGKVARWGEKEEGQGVFGKTAPSFPFLGPEQRRGGGLGGDRSGGRGAGGPSRGGGWGIEQYGEGDEGISSPCSPWTEAARGESSTAAADRWWWCLGRREWWSVGAEQASSVRCGATRGAAPAFYRPRRSVPGKKSSRRPWRRFRRGGPRRPAEDHVWFEDRWMVASLCDE